MPAPSETRLLLVAAAKSVGLFAIPNVPVQTVQRFGSFHILTRKVAVSSPEAEVHRNLRLQTGLGI